MKKLLLVLVLFGSLQSIAFDGLLSAADFYQGQVVDEETGQPLVGAVIAVVWYKTAAVHMERSLHFQNAQETVSDFQGKFSLLASPGIDFNPLTVIIKEPTIVIYQSGYEPVWSSWIVRMGFKSEAAFAAALKKGAVVKLSKLKTDKEKRQFIDGGNLKLIDIPPGALPKLMAAVNAQRKLVGLPPLLD